MSAKFKIILVILALSVWSVAFSPSANANDVHKRHQHNAANPFNKTNLNLHCLLKGHSLDNPCPHILKHLGSKSLLYLIGADCGGSHSQKKGVFAGFDITFMDSPAENIFIFSSGQTLALPSEKRTFLFYGSIKPPPKFL